MTAIEFNKKYENFIEDRFEGLEFDLPKITDFLDIIMEDLTRIPGFTFAQIKFKYGSARFYAENVSVTMALLIEGRINSLFNKYYNKGNKKKWQLI